MNVMIPKGRALVTKRFTLAVATGSFSGFSAPALAQVPANLGDAGDARSCGVPDRPGIGPAICDSGNASAGSGAGGVR
jgi:hypothetical protein